MRYSCDPQIDNELFSASDIFCRKTFNDDYHYNKNNDERCVKERMEWKRIKREGDIKKKLKERRQN